MSLKRYKFRFIIRAFKCFRKTSPIDIKNDIQHMTYNIQHTTYDIRDTTYDIRHTARIND